MMIRTTSHASGFTLLELLIAIAVFAVLAIMSYGTLSNVLQAQTQTRDMAQKLYRVQQAVLHLERDIMQIVVRPIRDEYGSTQNAVVGNESGKYRLEFSRTGRPNPMLAPRSFLQRVAYVMPVEEEHKLYRYVWPSMDRPDDPEAAAPNKLLLLDDVEELTLRFYSEDGEEQSSWPPQSQTLTQPSYTVMPKAIKVVLKLKGMGEIYRLFEMPVE